MAHKPLKPDTRLLVSVTEAARRLSISRRTLYRLIDRGEIREPIKIGSRTLMEVKDLEDFITRCRRSAS